jgi:flagellar biosynthetic protein FliQ
MDMPEVLTLARDLLTTTILISLPALLASLIVGLVISILQTITSLQEQTLSFVPRLFAVAIVLLLCLGWMLQLSIHFTMRMLWHAAEVVR